MRRDPYPGDRQLDERPAVRATVKWFNPEKGFGFVSPADGTPDAFLHAKVVQSAGVMELPPGSTVTCAIVAGMKGPQVTRLLEVDTSTATPTPSRRPPSGPRPPRDFGPRATGERQEIVGQVKWFNAVRGFGFVVGDDGELRADRPYGVDGELGAAHHPADLGHRWCVERAELLVEERQRGIGPLRGRTECPVTADDLAGRLDTIPYEVVCGIGPRVPRFYR